MKDLAIGQKVTVVNPVTCEQLRVGVIDQITDELYSGVELGVKDGKRMPIVFHVDNLISDNILIPRGL